MIINTLVLNKLGWEEYGKRIFYYLRNPGTVRFSISNGDIKYLYLDRYFIIQHKDTKSYFFVAPDDNDIKNLESGEKVDLMNCKLTLVKCNQDVLKLILQYRAFKVEYQRHFKLFNILKNDVSKD
jgi:hypothetical protein